MKKQLLFGTALAITVAGYSQRSVSPNVVIRPIDRAAELAAIRNADLHEEAPKSVLYGSGQLSAEQNRPASPPSTFSWGLLCGSMNAYGMLSSNQRPLQYHPDLNAVSFIHRKSSTYNETPSLPATAKSGVIVAEISTNWGLTWDSTCLYSNATDWGRYPQGGIYNPSGNKNIANAYALGSGPTVGASSFSGSWYASKQLNAFNTTAGTVPGAQQFYTFNGGTYPANMNRHAWPRNGFSVTNNGVAHALGILGDDLQGTSTMRGYAVLTGVFNGTAINWTMDSIIPSAILKADGVSKHLQEGQMVWNPAGTIGYVVGIGVRSGATLANRSYQPIIYKCDKTTNPSATWTLTSQLDFNTTFTTVGYHLPDRPVTYPVVNGSTTPMPYTNDFDIAIDKNNNLHIGIVFMSGYSDHPDSLNFYTSFGSAINTGESYKWQHLPGDRPYIYDFIGNGTSAWKMMTVDSIASEGPGFATGQSGYNENPWDNTGGNGQRLSIESRLQMGRTPDGEYISFSWSESDTLFTNNAFKYNTLPDVKVRLMSVASGTTSYLMNVGNEVNATGMDNNVRSRATLHYASPMLGYETISAASATAPTHTVDVKVPMTVTNSNPFSQLTNNATWFGNNKLNFVFLKPPPSYTATNVGIAEYSAMNAGLNVYPNPAHAAVLVSFLSDNGGTAELSVKNALGQTIRMLSLTSSAGENKIEVDLSGLATGIYLVNVTTHNSTMTKKLVVD
jgi:hypothetical protein